MFLLTLRGKEGSENKGECKRLYFAFFFLLYFSISYSCETVSISNREVGVIKITPIKKGEKKIADTVTGKRGRSQKMHNS